MPWNKFEHRQVQEKLQGTPWEADLWRQVCREHSEWPKRKEVKCTEAQGQKQKKQLHKSLLLRKCVQTLQSFKWLVSYNF